MSAPAYDAYRDSEVEWLGDVPSHWEVRRLKHIADAFPSNVDKKTYGDGTPVRLCNYTDVYYNDVIFDDPDFMVASATPEQIEKFTLRAGDTIITKDSETAADIATAAYVPNDMPGVVCGYHLSMIRPHRGTSGAFIKRYFDSAFAKASVAVRANGLTRVGLGQYAVDNLVVPVPPFTEQAAIAAFLNREIGKIDVLVEAQKRLIHLMTAKRRAVVSHAVTKGLDPSVKVKDSGIEGLGHSPVHWEVKALKHLGDFNAGAGFPDIEQGLQAEEIPFHKVNALALADAEGYLLRGENSVSSQTAKRLNAFVFPPRSIVFAKIGAALLLGRLRLLREPACLDNNMMGLTVRDDHDIDFVCSAMSLVKFDLISNPGTVPSLNKGQIANVKIAVPPRAEQEAISAWLRATGLTLDRLSAEADAAITLLRERRAALISAAVTGKIDVRGLIPEQAEAA